MMGRLRASGLRWPPAYYRTILGAQTPSHQNTKGPQYNFVYAVQRSTAAANGHVGVVKMLVESAGAVIDSKDINGHTPLSRALVNKHQEVVKVLQSFQ
jgi:hypothetical protein